MLAADTRERGRPKQGRGQPVYRDKREQREAEERKKIRGGSRIPNS